MVKEICCDVLVVGAGLSGVAAALAASEKGAQAILLEKNNFLGGTVIAGMHRSLCGLYGNTASMTLNSGIARRVSSDLRKRSSQNRPVRLGKVYVFNFRRNDLKECLQAMVRNKKNLKVILNSRACAVKQSKGLIEAVRVRKEGKVFSIRPQAVIDATGKGEVIILSRAKYRVASDSQRQLAGFSFRVKGLQGSQGMLPIHVPYYIKCAGFTPLENRGEGLIRLNIPVGRDRSGLIKEARKVLHRLRKVLPEFKDASIAEFSPYIVEREGIRLQGEYTLTADDLLRGRKFKDSVAKSSWHIEIWGLQKGPRYRYLDFARYYEIPLRCLKSKNIKNLLASGRCISVTHEALGSTRVAGTAITIGEQAGIAAAKLCVLRHSEPRRGEESNKNP